MTREEAIEVLRKLPVGLMDLRNEQKSDLTEAMESVFKICLDIVREASTIDPESLRPEWISVKDRLPEKNKDVLVFTELGKMAVAFHEGGIYWYLYAGDDSEGGYEPSGEKITHWAQLPNPPEGFEYREGWLPIAHYTYHGAQRF